MKKLSFIFALLCASMMGWASTELFNAANAVIDHTFFRTNGWAEETTPSTYDWSNGELTVSMTESKNEQWQAQVFLDTKITFDASKQYDISFDIITTNGVGGIMVKLGNTGTLYAETITTGASVLQHYAKQNVQGVAANDGMLIFDFGYAPANTNVTISNISIIEKEPVITPYCQRATGHLGNPNFGDPNGRILLTITKLSDSSVGVKVEPNNGGTDVFDFVQVELNGVAKTLGAIGGSAPTTAEIVYEGLASLNFNINILWHHKTWADAGGRWTTQQFAVKEAELCPAPLESEYCAYEDPQTIKNGKNIALTWETDESGNVVIKMSNGTGATSCSFRNGGFEGGIDAFVVSDDDFATTTPASNYFTAVQVYSGNTYTLTKKAELPANAKIKHVGSGHALAWVLNGNDEYCFPDFIYTYGSVCTEEPVLTSIALEASAKIAQVGEEVTLTASPLDQFGAPIEATINYAISPADAGSISGNVFTFAKTGAATITASSGTIEESITLYGVSSANLALNKTCEAGYWDGNNNEKATAANDGNEGTAWVTWSWQDAAVEWWYVDLGALYDITAISVLWGADYSNSYILQVRAEAPAEDDKADDEAWTTIVPATSASANSFAMNYLTTTGRYVRLHSLSRPTGTACIRLRELQVFGSEAATPTKSVSASVNDEAMGTATVKQNNADVTSVETGSTVTFAAIANEDYIFVDWSNGETNASFDAEVTENMNLTANFRALNHISCNEEMTNGDYTVYVTYRKTANENEYEFIVRSAKVMTGFSNAYIGKINGNNQVNLNGQGSLTGNGHKLSYTFTSTTEPKLNSPLYVNFANHGEVTFNQINGNTVFEFAVPCADPEITAIALDKTEATLDMGNTLTLVPSFTPAYMSADITWQTSDDTKATVSSGVVTPVAPGNVTITAKVSETIKATCAVTVQSAASHNWYGYGTDKDLDYTYRIEYTTDHHIVAHVKRQGDKTGLVPAEMLISGAWTTINVTEGEEDGWKKGTTEATFTAGDNIHILIQSAYAGPTSIIEFDYEVGSDNVMPVIVPSTLALSNTSITMGLSDADVQLTAEIHHRDAANQAITWTSDDENVVTVENGLVHPVGVGSTTVRANTFNNVEATCTVTVVGVLEPTVLWGNGADNGVSIAYSITRNTNHTLTYTVEALHSKEGFVVQVNDGLYHDATLNEGIYTWTSEATYTDGDVFSGFFYMPFSGGAARVDFVNYEVGSETARKYIPITLKDDDNNFVISASNNAIREVKLSRTFPNTDEWYTLCLPFDLSDEQLTEAFGAGYTLATLANSVDHGSLISLNFDFVNSFEAGKAYLLRPGTAVTENPVFEGVVVKNVNPADVAATSTLMNFQGTYNTIVLNSENQRFVGPENYLYSPAEGGTNMKAFRCFFSIPQNSPLNGAPGRPARIVFGEQTATGMESVQGDDVQSAKVLMDGQLFIIREGRIYNAQGTLVK
jgi:hypothetical protein